MKIDLLNRTQLELLNKRGPRYHLQDAEKDYFLAVILGILYNSALKKDLVFKGGTAIYHCYLEQLRFSRDLDFTSRTKLSPDDLRGVFAEYEIFRIKDIAEKKHSLNISVQYHGILAQPDTVEIDINTNQKVLLKPPRKDYKNCYGLKFSCLVMDAREIFAEKIRTLGDRARPRDIYDLVILQKRYGFKIKTALDLLGRKESPYPLDRTKIKDNLRVSLARFEQEMNELYYQQVLSKDDIEIFADKLLSIFRNH